MKPRSIMALTSFGKRTVLGHIFVGATFIIGAYLLRTYNWVPGIQDFMNLLIGLGAFFTVQGIVAFFILLGLWRGKGWVWTAYMAWLILDSISWPTATSLFISGPFLIWEGEFYQIPGNLPILVGLLALAVFLSIWDVIAIYYLSRPYVKHLFGKGPPPPVPTPPPITPLAVRIFEFIELEVDEWLKRRVTGVSKRARQEK